MLNWYCNLRTSELDELGELDTCVNAVLEKPESSQRLGSCISD
jgi:hypothetical protein